MEKSKVLQIRIEPDLLLKFQRFSESKNITMSELLIQHIAILIREDKKRKK